MRYREMSDKEIVNVDQGTKLGILGQTDLEINTATGHIEALIIPQYKWFGLKKESDAERIRWRSIQKIGTDMIMIHEEE